MTKNASFEAFAKQIDQGLMSNPNDADLRKCQQVLKQTAEFLSGHNLVVGLGGTSAAALESFDHTPPKLNSSIKLAGDGEMQSALEEFVDKTVPKAISGDPRKRASMIKQLGRILSGDNVSLEHFTENRNDGTYATLDRLVGTGAYAQFAADAKQAIESFSTDMDRVQTDVRLNVALTVLRSYKSLTDRVLPRISEQDSVVTVKIPENEVYDLSKAADPSSAVRYGGTHRQPMVTLFRTPDAVSTEPKRVVIDPDNDTGTPAVLVDGSLKAGSTANLFDLSMDANRVGFDHVDGTDLLAEGGIVETLYVNVKMTDGGDTDELYKIDVSYQAGARFTMIGNAPDASSRAATFRVIDGKNTKDNGVLADGSTTVIFDGLADFNYRLQVDFNAKIDLKTGEVTGSGSVSGAMVHNTTGAAPAGGSAAAVLAAKLTVQLIAYDVKVFFSEENVRKATVAIRQNFRPHTFEIPNGRTAVVDVSLQSATPEATLDAVSTINSIGNSARALAVYDGHLAQVASRNAYEDLEGAAIPHSARVSREYAAGSLVLPRVIEQTIDLSDSEAAVAVMRESERLSDLHARVRSRMLAMIAKANTMSLYPNVLDPGETPVWKVIGDAVLVDMLFGIDDYHNMLNDKPEGGRQQAGSDYSMLLPNGTRLDVYKTDFTNYKNKLIAFPVRQANPEDITSFAAIRDRGTFVGSYNRSEASAAHKRFIVNSREIPFVTNPVGLRITVTGLSTYYPELG